jgi:CheY-like chemotaxis protein
MSKTILVVDDEPDVVTYLSTVLKDAGYDTLEAACTCLDRVDSKNSPSCHAAVSFSNLASASAGLMKPIEACILARL